MKTFLLIIGCIVGYFSGMFAVNTGADVYSDTIMLEARAKLSERYQKQIEQRLYNSKILDMFLASSTVIDPRFDMLPDGRTAKLEYLKSKTMTVNTARACTRTGEQSGSGIDTVTFVDREVAISINKAQAFKNDYAYAEILASELWNAEKSLFLNGTNSIDAYLATQLAAWVSTVNNGDGYDGTLNGSIMEIASADVKRFYSIARGHVRLNNYDGVFYDLSDTMWNATHKAVNFGVQTNLMDDATAEMFIPFTSNRLTPGAGYGSRHYLVAEGGVGFINNIPDNFKPENREMRGTYERFTINSMIYPGITLCVKRVMSCADTSTSGGRTDDDVDTFHVSMQFAAFKVPTSVSGDNPIFDYRTVTP